MKKEEKSPRKKKTCSLEKMDVQVSLQQCCNKPVRLHLRTHGGVKEGNLKVTNRGRGARIMKKKSESGRFLDHPTYRHGKLMNSGSRNIPDNYEGYRFCF